MMHQQRELPFLNVGLVLESVKSLRPAWKLLQASGEGLELFGAQTKGRDGSGPSDSVDIRDLAGTGSYWLPGAGT